MAARINLGVVAGSMDGGGSERQTLLLLQHLDRERFRPHLFLQYRRGVLLPELPGDVPVTAFWDHHSPARGISWPGRIHQRQIRWLRRSLAALLPGPVVLYDRTYHSTLIAGPATATLPIPRISTIVAPPDRDLSPDRERFVWLKRKRLATAYRAAFQVVAVSRAVAESSESFYRLPASSVRTVYNAIDIELVKDRAAEAPPVMPERGGFHILCAGRLSGEKGQADLIAAFQSLSPEWLREHRVHLWFAGDGPLRQELEQQARQSDLPDQVHFTGHLANVPALMTRCQLLCIPSRYEGLPNVALEALALGLPVLGTRAGGTPEVLERTPAGRLVSAGAPGELAAAIRQITENPLPPPTPDVLNAFELSTYLETVESLFSDAADSIQSAPSA